MIFSDEGFATFASWCTHYLFPVNLMYITREGLVSKNRLLEEAHEGLQICVNWCTSMVFDPEKLRIASKYQLDYK